MTVIICPSYFDAIVRSSEKVIESYRSDERRKTLGYTETKTGAWCSDTFRVHYTCESEDLPDYFKKYTKMEGHDTGHFLVEPRFLRWLADCVKMAGKSTRAQLHLTADGWEWKTDWYSFSYRQPAPIASDIAGLDAQFLRDALLFMEAQGKVVTFAATPGKMEPWILGYNKRSAIIMPARL
jgi:hypothetical protein